EKDQKVYFSGGTDNPYNYNGVGYNGKPAEPSPVTFAFNIRTGKWETINLNTPDATMDHRGLWVIQEGLVIVGGMQKGQQVTAKVVVMPKQPKSPPRLQLPACNQASNFWLSVGPMKRWQLVVLIFELALFAAILVLPQVALPAFTFHSGTAPVVAHARVCQSGLGAVVAAIPQSLFPNRTVYGSNEIAVRFVSPTPHSRLSRLCVLIC